MTLEELMKLHADSAPHDDMADYPEFYSAAHAALGPDGCISQELERLITNVGILQDQRDKYCAAADSTRDELSAARAEIERLNEALALAEAERNELNDLVLEMGERHG